MTAVEKLIKRLVQNEGLEDEFDDFFHKEPGIIPIPFEELMARSGYTREGHGFDNWVKVFGVSRLRISDPDESGMREVTYVNGNQPLWTKQMDERQVLEMLDRVEGPTSESVEDDDWKEILLLKLTKPTAWKDLADGTVGKNYLGQIMRKAGDGYQTELVSETGESTWAPVRQLGNPDYRLYPVEWDLATIKSVNRNLREAGDDDFTDMKELAPGWLEILMADGYSYTKIHKSHWSGGATVRANKNIGSIAGRDIQIEVQDRKPKNTLSVFVQSAKHQEGYSVIQSFKVPTDWIGKVHVLEDAVRAAMQTCHSDYLIFYNEIASLNRSLLKLGEADNDDIGWKDVEPPLPPEVVQNQVEPWLETNGFKSVAMIGNVWQKDVGEVTYGVVFLKRGVQVSKFEDVPGYIAKRATKTLEFDASDRQGIVAGLKSLMGISEGVDENGNPTDEHQAELDGLNEASEEDLDRDDFKEVTAVPGTKERWAFTAYELGQHYVDPESTKKLNSRDEFFVQVEGCELGVIVERNGTITNRWEDGTAGVPEEVQQAADYEETLYKFRRDQKSEYLDSSDSEAYDWEDVFVDGSGYFVAFVEPRTRVKKAKSL